MQGHPASESTSEPTSDASDDGEAHAPNAEAGDRADSDDPDTTN
jgi:hypothetical protein